MRVSRPSIAGLMGMVVFIAVGLAAMIRPTTLWAALLTTAFLAALTVALIATVNARGNRRAFWSGFLIAGWSFLLLDYRTDLVEALGRWELPDILIHLIEDAFRPSAGIEESLRPSPGPTDRNPEAFHRIGHMLIGWLAASAGGLIGRAMAGPRPVEGAAIAPGGHRVP